jgi:hypothetical protein
MNNLETIKAEAFHYKWIFEIYFEKDNSNNNESIEKKINNMKTFGIYCPLQSCNLNLYELLFKSLKETKKEKKTKAILKCLKYFYSEDEICTIVNSIISQESYIDYIKKLKKFNCDNSLWMKDYNAYREALCFKNKSKDLNIIFSNFNEKHRNKLRYIDDKTEFGFFNYFLLEQIFDNLYRSKNNVLNIETKKNIDEYIIFRDYLKKLHDDVYYKKIKEIRTIKKDFPEKPIFWCAFFSIELMLKHIIESKGEKCDSHHLKDKLKVCKKLNLLTPLISKFNSNMIDFEEKIEEEFILHKNMEKYLLENNDTNKQKKTIVENSLNHFSETIIYINTIKNKTITKKEEELFFYNLIKRYNNKYIEYKMITSTNNLKMINKNSSVLTMIFCFSFLQSLSLHVIKTKISIL